MSTATQPIATQSVAIKLVDPEEGGQEIEIEASNFHEIVDRMHPGLADFTNSKELCHIKDFFDVQRSLLQCCLGSGEEWHRDCLLVASTGSGKTLAFLLLVIHKILFKLEALEDRSIRNPRDYLPQDPHCIIVVPSRELACQIYDVARAVSQTSHELDE